MFGFLLFVKSFHWLAADRIEWVCHTFTFVILVIYSGCKMDQRPYPGPPPLFHVRMSTLFLILWTTDFLVFLIAVENTVANGVGGMVLFASEVSHMISNVIHLFIIERYLQYAILMASVLNTISKYLLSAYELRRAGQRGGEHAPPWENKSMWVFYIELSTGMYLHPPSRYAVRTHCEMSRFLEIDDIPRFLYHHHYVLWFAP
jgi:hypothetical protein